MLTAAALVKSLVCLFKLEYINKRTDKQVCIACFFDSYLSEHLTCDYLNVLVVDVNTLHTVSSLNFTGNIYLNGVRSVDS